MKLHCLILFSTLALASSFLFNTSSPGTPTSAEYTKMGYMTFHNSSCSFQTFAPPDGHLDGIRAMEQFANLFVTTYNKAARKLKRNSYVRRKLQNGNSNGNSNGNRFPDYLLTNAEISRQELRQVSRKRRDLMARDFTDRELQSISFFRYNLSLGQFICKLCLPENDARRQLQSFALAETEFLEDLQKSIIKSDLGSISDGLKKTKCLRVSCDNKPWRGTEGCASYPLPE